MYDLFFTNQLRATVTVHTGRQTYVFNASGKCVLSFNDQLNAEKHVEEALAALK